MIDLRTHFARRFVALVIGSAAVFALATQPAEAKGPEAGDMPSVKEILKEAKDAKEAAEKAAIEAARDPRKEAIEAYRDGKTPLEDFSALTDMINDAKDDEVQAYRNQAAKALLTRFVAENDKDPHVRTTRAAVGLAIVDLMKAPTSDTVGLAIIQEVIQTWWSTKNREVRFKATDKRKTRLKAFRSMKSYLQGGER